jgi:hypothetical protein
MVQRMFGGFVRYRRIECEEGHVFSTYEVPSQFISEFGVKKCREVGRRVKRGVERRKASYLLRLEVIARLEQSWKPTAIGHELGISEARVRQIRSEERNASYTPNRRATARLRERLADSPDAGSHALQRVG